MLGQILDMHGTPFQILHTPLMHTVGQPYCELDVYLKPRTACTIIYLLAADDSLRTAHAISDSLPRSAANSDCGVVYFLLCSYLPASVCRLFYWYDAQILFVFEEYDFLWSKQTM